MVHTGADSHFSERGGWLRTAAPGANDGFVSGSIVGVAADPVLLLNPSSGFSTRIRWIVSCPHLLQEWVSGDPEVIHPHDHYDGRRLILMEPQRAIFL